MWYNTSLSMTSLVTKTTVHGSHLDLMMVIGVIAAFVGMI